VFFRVLLVGFGLFGPGVARAPPYLMAYIAREDILEK